MKDSSDNVLKLGRWRILVDMIGAVYVFKPKGMSFVDIKIILTTGYEIHENEADIEEAKTLVTAWGAYNGLDETTE